MGCGMVYKPDVHVYDSLAAECPDCTEEGLQTETSIHDDDAVYMLKTDRRDS